METGGEAAAGEVAVELVVGGFVTGEFLAKEFGAREWGVEVTEKLGAELVVVLDSCELGDGDLVAGLAVPELREEEEEDLLFASAVFFAPRL